MNIVPKFIQKRIEHRPNLLKIVDNIGWLFLDKILRMSIGILIGIWVARYLGPEQFGLLAFATAFVGIFGSLSGLGLQEIVVRDIVRYQTESGVIIGSAALLQFIGGLISYGLIIGVICWLHPNDLILKLLVAILGSTVLFRASEVLVYWFEAQILYKYVVWVQNFCFIGFAIIKLSLIFHHAPLIAFAWATMAEALVVGVLLVVIFNLKGPGFRQLSSTLQRQKTLLMDCWPLLLSAITIVIYMRIDQVMLGYMVDNESVGIYSAALRISEAWYFIPMALAASTFPAILDAKKRSKTLYYQRLQFLYNIMVWLAVCVALPMTFLSTPIVTLLFGEAYTASGPILAIHIWTGVFVFLGVASGKWFIAEGLQVMSFQRAILGASLNVVINLVLIPSYGAVGAALATLISQATAAWFFDALQLKTRKMFFMKTKAMSPWQLISFFIGKSK